MNSSELNSSEFKPVLSHPHDVDRKPLNRSKSEIGSIRLKSLPDIPWLKDLNQRGTETSNSLQAYKNKVKLVRIESDSKDNSNRKSKSEDNIVIEDSLTSIDSTQVSLIEEQEAKSSPLTDVNTRADSIQRNILLPEPSDGVSVEKTASNSQRRALIKRSRSQQLQNSRLSSQFEKEIKLAIKELKESPFAELDTIIDREIEENLSKVKKDPSSTFDGLILSPLEKITSSLSSSPVLLSGLMKRLELVKKAVVNNSFQWQGAFPYLFLIAVDKLIAKGSSVDDFKKTLDAIQDGRMRIILFDVLGGEEAKECLADRKDFVEQRFLAIESKNQKALALRQELNTCCKDLIKNNLNVALEIDPHFPYIMKSLREVVESCLVKVKDWEVKGQAKKAISPVSTELIEKLSANKDLLSRCVERVIRMKSLLHDRVAVYKIGES